MARSRRQAVVMAPADTGFAHVVGGLSSLSAREVPLAPEAGDSTINGALPSCPRNVRGETAPSLDEIAKDAQRTIALPPEIATVLLGRCAVAQARLLVAALTAVPSTDRTPGDDAHAHDDRLLDVEEAAIRLGVSKDWIYRKASRLPFTVRLGPRRLRFSTKGIDKFIQHRQGRA
jgi:predicted DNA-binding transcriptional regulator AlpA